MDATEIFIVPAFVLLRTEDMITPYGHPVYMYLCGRCVCIENSRYVEFESYVPDENCFRFDPDCYARKTNLLIFDPASGRLDPDRACTIEKEIRIIPTEERTPMELQYKNGIESTRNRWARFWKGESDRPLLYSIRPKSGVAPIDAPNPYDCAFGDIDPLIDQVLGWASTHEFLGDSVPFYMITFAPDHFAALLGAEIQEGEGTKTNWIDPCLTNLSDAEITFQREGYWWKRTLECIEKFRQRCDGKLIISGTHYQGGLDCLAAMYGTQNLLMDMAIAPESVHRALLQVDAALAEARKALAEALDIASWGSVNRFGMYSSGMIDVPQCDISCMISPAMFDEFELPSLTKEIATIDASIYHLDGPDALQHTESLCAIDRLDMIQWMPGEGYYDDDWTLLNKKIDSLGKGQIFQSYYKFKASDIKKIWDSYTSRKLFFHVKPEVLAELPWS